MSVTRGRLLKGGGAEVVLAPSASQAPFPRGRRLPRAAVEATRRAEATLKAAQERAAEIVRDAERRAQELARRAEEEGRAEGAARLAAHAIARADYETKLSERRVDDLVRLATLLAERLLGKALELSPELVLDLAQQIVREARGARQLVIEAHPDDVPILEGSFDTLGIDPAAARVQSDERRPRGALRVVTEIGVLDGDLSPQLERLGARLRQSLKDGL